MSQNLSDDFNRADGDSLGANWTEQVGDIDIATNRAVINTTGFSDAFAVHNTPCDSVHQYVKISWLDTADSGERVYAIFRYTDSTSPFYLVNIGPTADFVAVNRADDNYTITEEFAINDPASWTVASGDSVGITCSGLGTDVTFNLWKNPTGNSPTSASVWGGAGPDIAITANPTTPVDTGNLVGFGGSSNVANTVKIDSWWGGDIPASGGPQAKRLVNGATVRSLVNAGLVN